VDEFELIRVVVEHLGDRAQGPWITLGPGDDAAVIAQRVDHQAVASIDTVVAGVHFPAHAAPIDVGYRALMVGLSDLAAMAAYPRYVLVALTIDTPEPAWLAELAQGMAQAATACDTYLCGGNFARGDLSITVSVHGDVPQGRAITRQGARAGDRIYVSGELGGAAACVRQRDFDFAGGLNDLQARYMRPQARFDVVEALRAHASAAIDVSDGLSADLHHLCQASGVRANLCAVDIPVFPGAQLDDALCGGDDYEILCTSSQPMPGMTCIGEIERGQGVYLDGAPLPARGYNHFVD